MMKEMSSIVIDSQEKFSKPYKQPALSQDIDFIRPHKNPITNASLFEQPFSILPTNTITLGSQLNFTLPNTCFLGEMWLEFTFPAVTGGGSLAEFPALQIIDRMVLIGSDGATIHDTLAGGYKPLISTLFSSMENKDIDTILADAGGSNGATPGLSLVTPGAQVVTAPVITFWSRFIRGSNPAPFAALALQGSMQLQVYLNNSAQFTVGTVTGSTSTPTTVRLYYCSFVTSTPNQISVESMANQGMYTYTSKDWQMVPSTIGAITASTSTSFNLNSLTGAISGINTVPTSTTSSGNNNNMRLSNITAMQLSINGNLLYDITQSSVSNQSSIRQHAYMNYGLTLYDGLYSSIGLASPVGVIRFGYPLHGEDSLKGYVGDIHTNQSNQLSMSSLIVDATGAVTFIAMLDCLFMIQNKQVVRWRQ